MKATLLLVLAVGLFVASASAQYGYDYSYGYDFYDSDTYGGYGDAYSYGGDEGYGYGGGYGGDDSGYAGDEFAYSDDNYMDAAGGYGGDNYGAMGDGYGDPSATGGYYDQYGYYGDEDQAYYEYYGYYTDDFAGYEDYYSEEYDFYEECFFDAYGTPVLLNGTASCDMKIQGVDTQADKLTGGLDGAYKFVSCYNGKPLYQRQKSPTGEDRVLWYSSTFGDWDVSRGTEPNEAEILMYGGEMEHASTPLFVSSWHLGGDLRSSGVEVEYAPIAVKVTCADGTKYKPGEVTTNTQRGGPALTDAEIEAKYQYIYDRYRTADPSPSINLTFVVLLVMTGLTIVLAIPYFLLKKRGTGAKGSGEGKLSMSFAQMLNNSRKKSAGHTN
ncbi:hypothetical protein FOA52_003334 [Chlamydomonas sp. UWO 241]|nr:hypothetical protein FOA52_003334 [Chlamydomonas sp. UWO 241]